MDLSEVNVRLGDQGTIVAKLPKDIPWKACIDIQKVNHALFALLMHSDAGATTKKLVAETLDAALKCALYSIDSIKATSIGPTLLEHIARSVSTHPMVLDGLKKLGRADTDDVYKAIKNSL